MSGQRRKGGQRASYQHRDCWFHLDFSALRCPVAGPLSNDFHSGRDSCVHTGFIWYRYFNPSLLRDPLKHPPNHANLQLFSGNCARKCIECSDRTSLSFFKIAAFCKVSFCINFGFIASNREFWRLCSKGFWTKSCF